MGILARTFGKNSAVRSLAKLPCTRSNSKTRRFHHQRRTQNRSRPTTETESVAVLLLLPSLILISNYTVLNCTSISTYLGIPSCDRLFACMINERLCVSHYQVVKYLNNICQVFHWSKLLSRLKCVHTSVGALVESLLQPTGSMGMAWCGELECCALQVHWQK
jgi:hypothetical protein